MSADRRILYAQYTNPANYPPLQHSARLLAEEGWQVKLMGIRTRGADLHFPQHQRIALSRRGAAAPGALQKLHYLAYATSVLREVRKWRPQWVYASDLWSCPIAHAALRFGCRVIYHEHDQPSQQGSVFLRYCLRARRRLARRAAACILPNQQRLDRFAQDHPEARTMLVWNCPSLSEVQPARASANARKPFVLYYHGSIGAPHVPVALIGALRLLPGDVRLRLVGYETAGSNGYSDTLKLQARNFGVEARTEWKGALSREQLWQQMRDAAVGISLAPLRTDESNLDTLAGASNKTFDYLASGLALLISSRDDWTVPFGAYGEACDPTSVESIASALQQLYGNRQATTERGENGRQRILSEWNYESQFAPVRELLNA